MLHSRQKRLRQLAAVAQATNLLFLRLLRRKPSRARSFPNRIYRDYLALSHDAPWRCASIFDVLEKRDRVRAVIEHIPSDAIETPLEQLACLALLTRAVQPRAVFEIGTFRGRTALNFALNAPEDARIYTLDLPSEERPNAIDSTNPADAEIIRQSETGSDYRGSDVEHKIVQLLGDSTTFDFSSYEGRMDMVHVDGAHHYDAVRTDSVNALRMVKPGGLVLWDEFANLGDYHDVTRAILDIVPAEHVLHIHHTQLAVYKKPVSGGG